jgi:hypothetical protein
MIIEGTNLKKNSKETRFEYPNCFNSIIFCFKSFEDLAGAVGSCL